MTQKRKPTRAEKIAKGDKKPEAKQSGVEVVKEKGPVPASYAPNNTHKIEAERQAFAKKIADARAENQNFDLVSGKTGTYLSGYSEGNYTEGHYFDVITKVIPGKNGKGDYPLTLIQGDVSANEGSELVSIPHSWLFKNIDTIKFAHGVIGNIQRKMLEFLQRVLASEIAEEKYRRSKDFEASKKAATVVTALENRDHSTALFSLATSDGKSVEQPGTLSLSSHSNFGPKQYNLYNFPSEGNRSCVVEYTVLEGIDVLRIRSMHAEHQLAKAGVKVGLVMFAKHLNKSHAIPTPDYDLSIEVYTHLCLFRGFLLQALDQVNQKKQREVA